MRQKLDIQKLATAVENKRRFLSLGLRAAAKEIGISYPTLSRVEKGSIPDLDTFFLLCTWLNVDAEEFISGGDKEELSEEKIIAHFRADRLLDPETIDLIEKMVRFAYNQRRCVSPH